MRAFEWRCLHRCLPPLPSPCLVCYNWRLGSINPLTQGLHADNGCALIAPNQCHSLPKPTHPPRYKYCAGAPYRNIEVIRKVFIAPHSNQSLALQCFFLTIHMPSFKLTVVLLDPESQTFPLLTLSELQPGEPPHCTCQEIINTTLRLGELRSKFTLQIVCHSTVTLQSAIEAHNRLLQESSSPSTITEGQKVLFREWKLICDCATQPEPSTAVSKVRQHGASERGRARRWALAASSKPAPPLSDTTRSATSTGYGFRLPPSVLKLNKHRQEVIVKQHVNKKIKNAIRQPLKVGLTQKNRFRPGYIYIMAADSRPGFMKIGFSKDEPIVREKKIRECFPDVRLVASTNLIPHAQKVERLVHTELLYLCRWFDCEVCGKQHEEWFETSQNLAVQVVYRWSAWMACSPYDQQGALEKDWGNRLKEKLVANLAPASDHLLGHNTWQQWTDAPRSKGAVDFSSRVEIIQYKKIVSPWNGC